MIRIAWRSLTAHKLRTILTVLAVLLDELLRLAAALRARFL